MTALGTLRVWRGTKLEQTQGDDGWVITRAYDVTQSPPRKVWWRARRLR